MNAGSLFRIFWLMSAFLLAACTAQERMVDSTDLAAEGGIEPQILVHGDPTEGQARLMNALREAGAQVEFGDPIQQDFFSIMGRVIKLNGADVQVFEYHSADAMEADAAQVSADGSSIGTSMVAWMATPHFFKSGQMLLLYVGDDPAVLDTLIGVLGGQFAGR